MHKVVQSLRAQAEVLSEQWRRAAFEPASLPQVQLVASTMELVLGPGDDLRHLVLRTIFPWGLHGPVASTKDLSKVQASVLIGWLYGLGPDGSLTAESMVDDLARLELLGLAVEAVNEQVE